MAIAFVAQRLNTTSASLASGANLGMLNPQFIAKGNHLIFTLVCDNSGTAGVAPSFTITDPRGNLWSKLGTSIMSSGATNDGVYVEMWISRTQYPYNSGDQLTLSVTPNVARANFYIVEFSGIRGVTYPAVGPSAQNNPLSTTSTLSITPSAAGQIVLGAVGVETNVVLTGDADVLNGAWSAIQQNVSDSGVAATSTRLAFQYKIVTAPGAQNWSTTWAGSADWANLAVVLDPATVDPNPMMQGNPNYSCIAGPEILPTESAVVPVDTGTVYMLQHEIEHGSIGTAEYTVTAEFLPPAEKTSHTVAFDLYPEGNQYIQDSITTLVLPLLAVGTGGAGVSVVGGGTVLDALNRAGGSYVAFNSVGVNPYVNLHFNPNILDDYANSRVVRIGLRYLAWKEDTSPVQPGEGFDVFWGDTSTGIAQHGSWLAVDYQNDARYVTRWLGETNLVPRGVDISTNHWRMPFTVADLQRMDTFATYVQMLGRGGFLLGPPYLQAVVNLDTVEMVVEVVPERRIGVANRFVSNLLDTSTSNFRFDYTRSVEMRYALNTQSAIALSNEDYVLGVREALPASPSDRWRVWVAGAAAFTLAEAVGPSLKLKAVRQPRATLEPQPILTRGTLSGGVLASELEDFDQYTLSVIAYDAGNVGIEGPFWVGYEGLSGEIYQQIYDGHSAQQLIYVPGGVTYDRVRLLIKPDPLTTDDLLVEVAGATATITTLDALAAPEVGEGWHEISVALSAPITPVAGTQVIELTSTTLISTPWRVATASAPGGVLSPYYYTQPFATQFGGDHAAVLQCEMPIPSLVMSQQNFPLARGAVRCVTNDRWFPVLTISNAADFDRLVFERYSESEGGWVIVGTQKNYGSTTSWADYGPPWDTPIEYRVTGYRDSDRRSTVSATVPAVAIINAPGIAFGLVGPTPIGYVSMGYVPVDAGGLTVEWTPLSPVQNIPLHGLDYSVALRAPEDRGLSVTVTVVVENFMACIQDGVEPANTFYDESFTPGTQSFSPKPYDILRGMERASTLILQLPGGHTRFVSLDLGGMTIRTQHGIYLATITLTDVQPFPNDPYLGE